MKKLFISIMCFTLLACASNQIKPEDRVCNNIPEGSYSVLCSVADHVGIELEDAGNVLKIANLGGLATDLYTARAASDFIDNIEIYLKRAQSRYGLLYSTFIDFVNQKYKILPAKVQAAIVLADQMRLVDVSKIPGANKLFSEYDYENLYKHLKEHRAIIKPFEGGMFNRRH